MRRVRNQPNKQNLGVEERLVRDLDRKADLLEFYTDVWPLIKNAARIKNIDKMLKDFSPTAILILMRQAMSAKSEMVRQTAAKELLYMSEGKPIQRQYQITRNVDKMPEAEVDSMIRGLLRAARREDAISVREPVTVRVLSASETEDPKA